LCENSDFTDTWSLGTTLNYYVEGIDATSVSNRPYSLIPFLDRLGSMGLSHRYVERDTEASSYNSEYLQATQYGLNGQYSIKSTNTVLRASYNYLDETVWMGGSGFRLVPDANENNSEPIDGRWTTEYDLWVYLLGINSFENPTDPTTVLAPLSFLPIPPIHFETHIFSVGYGYYIRPMSLLSIDYTYSLQSDEVIEHSNGFRADIERYDTYQIRVSSFSVIALNEQWISIEAGIAYDYSFDESEAEYYSLDAKVDYFLQKETSIGVEGGLRLDEDGSLEEKSIGGGVTHYFKDNLSLTARIGYQKEESEPDSISFQVGVQIRL